MQDIETYLDRANEALRLCELATGHDAKLAILDIVRTWLTTAERRAERLGVTDAGLAATFEDLHRSIERAGAGL